MMEKFVFLDSNGKEISCLTYAESAEAGRSHSDSVKGFVTILNFAAIQSEYQGLDKQQQTELLCNIHSIREEYSGAVVTRAQLIQAVKADPFYFSRNLRDLLRALPELADLKPALREKWGERLYAEYLGELQRPAPPQPT